MYLVGCLLSSDEMNTQLVAYPNPTSGIVNLNEMENAMILVKDMSGRIVMNTLVNDGKVNLSNLENGFYLIQSTIGSSTKINILK